MSSGDERECQRCRRAVVVNAAMYDVFERMHWSCFHYEFEHEGDPDAACGDPSCPARSFDSSPPPTWTEQLHGTPERRAVYLVEFEEGGQLGGFTTLAEAERLVALAASEGRHGPLTINGVPLHDRLEDWERDR